MNEPAIRIRCPGCGSVTAVSLAVGQQLPCGTCGTLFLAPILSAEDLQAMQSSRTDFEVAGEPWRGFHHSPSEGSDLPGRHGARAEPEIGQTQAWQTADWDKPAVSIPGQRPNRPRVEPLSVDHSAVPSPPVSASGEDAVDSRLSRLWHLVLCFAAVALTSACIGGAVYVIRAFDREAEEETTQVGAAVQVQPGSRPEGPVRWIDATRSAQRKQGVIAKVESASYGAVRAKDVNRRVITTDDDNLIALTVSVSNRGRADCPFHSWYGNTFETDNGDVLIAELFDDQSRSYQMLKFDDVSSLQGQRLADEIAAGDFVRDTLVFVVPEDVDRKKIEYFRLALPAIAVGMDGNFRFEIPVSMITNY